MMQQFRKLSNHFLFKIFLGFLALSFVLFGVSNFVLGGFGQWVAEVDGQKISYTQFQREMESNRQIVYQNAGANSQEASKYLASDQFKSDSLNKMVNKIIIQKLKQDLGVIPSKELILQTIAEDPNLKGVDGKFSTDLYKDMVARSGLSEEQYISNVQNEIAAMMIIQSLSLVAPTDKDLALDLAQFYQEKRVADLITISAKNVPAIAAPTNKEIESFFEKHTSDFSTLANRKVEYLHFASKDLAKNIQVSESEITDEYNNNKEQFSKPESRNFYNVTFEKKEQADKFLVNLKEKTANNQLSSAFIALAKEMTDKDQKSLTLENITRQSLIPDLANPLFLLKEGQHSEVLTSPLGYHVFLLTKINQPAPIPLAEAKKQISEKLLQNKKEKLLKDKVGQIEDELLTSNSLEKTGAKFGFQVVKDLPKLDQNGAGLNGQKIDQIKGFDDFVDNAFSLALNQTSKLYYSKANDQFYAVMVTEINDAKARKLDEVRPEVTARYMANIKAKKLQELANNIAKELKEKPQNMAAIIAKYQLKLEKNHEFPRMIFIDYQGRKIPYASKFLEELFAIKLGDVTSPQLNADAKTSQEFIIGILREIKKAPEPKKEEINSLTEELSSSFKQEVLQQYYQYIQKKFPVKINQKLLEQMSEAAKKSE